MATSKKTASSRNETEAINLLISDHKMVQKQFKEFEKLKDGDGDDNAKGEIVQQVCTALTIHAQIEEEIFYPAVREAIGDEDLMDEAEVEHATAKETIAQLQGMQPGDELYDAKFTVLGEYVNHHIDEEQNEMFPKVKKAKVDTAALGLELMQRKQELEAEMGLEPDQAAKAPPKQPSRKPAARMSR
ncbi:MAG: hemerythrin domain-containing protein [Betaproteobacteria bacterium]